MIDLLLCCRRRWEVRAQHVKQASGSDTDDSSRSAVIGFLTRASVESGVSTVFGAQTV